MARPTLEQIRQLGDFATTYQWEFTLEYPKVGDLGGVTGLDINTRMVSITPPSVSYEVLTAGLKGHNSKQAGPATYTSSIDLETYSTIDGKIYKAFKKWKEYCTKTNIGSHEKKLDAEARVTLLHLDRQDKPFWKYRIIGAWPMEVEVDSFSHDSEIHKVRVKLAYDYFEEEAVNNNGGSGLFRS